MPRLARMLAPALAAACVALALGGTASSGATGRAPLLTGINVPGLYARSVPAEADRAIALAAKLHAKVVRADFTWSVLEPTGPTIDPRALAYTDRLVADAAAAGIKVSATVANTPCWDSSAPKALLARCGRGRGGGAASSWPPRDPAPYAALLGALAQRYGNRLAAIEVWNEPDQANEAYFAGPGKAARYAQLLRAAYPAVKQADPSLAVLAGSLVGSNGAFLRALYAAGIKGYYDGLSVHYYNLTLASLRAIHQAQLAGGDAKPLWLDEFGWTSCWPGRAVEQEQACVSTGTQALNLRNAIREMARAPYIAAAVVYKLQDSRAEDFGALNSRGARKPSFRSLEEAFGNPFGSFSHVTVSLRRQGGRLVASGGGPVGDYMQLEARSGGLLYRALFKLDRFNRYSLPLPAVLGTSGVTVKVFQYWTGATRAAAASG